MTLARPAAALIALAAGCGLILQLGVSIDRSGGVIRALWSMAGFFTIIINLWVAILFTGLASGRASFARPSRVGGATLWILLVGAVYAILLQRTEHLSGAAQTANVLMHHVTPILVPLYWLFLGRRGLRPRDPWLWATVPIAYLIYAIVRGRAQGYYAYPFLDGTKQGWGAVALTVLVIAACFLVAGAAMVRIDRRLARR